MYLPKALLFGALCLVGCNTPTLDFAGIPPIRVEVDGSKFDVRLKGDIAQAIRVNTQWAPSATKMRPKFKVAFEQASGCEVEGMKGDAALMVAYLKCD